MSKGTKQIRLGRVERFLAGLKQRLEILEDLQKTVKPDAELDGRVRELRYIIEMMELGFEI